MDKQKPIRMDEDTYWELKRNVLDVHRITWQSFVEKAIEHYLSVLKRQTKTQQLKKKRKKIG